ncbi:helix-turn-helix domain-containing protein [Microbacterium sp. NPDC090225]|uniref:helix-turn-helix domain-containing protein n=1 Tax=Microbacterium sp. NPDC090225 TaxID=3364207 RepID=UPI0037FF1AC9
MTVAENIARIRKSQQLSLQDVEDKLTALGRRISFSGLSKIERGQKRVDVDDLMSIAIALDVTPNALLLPLADPDTTVEVSGAKGSLGLFWEWASAERTPFGRDQRSFLARSLPHWMDAPGPGLTWFGRITLSMGVGGADPEPIETHDFAAKTNADVDWERTRP